MAQAERVVDGFVLALGDSDATYSAMAAISRAGGAGSGDDVIMRAFNDPGLLDRPWWWLAVTAERANSAGQERVAAKIAAFTEMFVVLFLPKLTFGGSLDAGLSAPPAAARARIAAAGLVGLAKFAPDDALLGRYAGYRLNDGSAMELTVEAIERQVAAALVELDRRGTVVTPGALERSRAVLAGTRTATQGFDT